MVGCCRRRARTIPKGSSYCKRIEQGGSQLRLWIAAHQGSYKLLMRNPDTMQFVDVLQFIAQNKCNGAMASMVRTHANRILDAIRRDPATMRKKAANGTSLTALLKTADAVLKQGGKNVVQAHQTRR